MSEVQFVSVILFVSLLQLLVVGGDALGSACGVRGGKTKRI